MAGEGFGSLSKEPPLSTLDETIRAIVPGMTYSDLLSIARVATHRDAPGLIRSRYLLVNSDGTIAYDHFLSLTKAYDLKDPIVRKVMYFLWAYRDERIRRFICERIADKSGLWSVSQLLRKQNSSFFETWMQPSTAKKARSNFEFFLVETGIFDPNAGAVHLELGDGWLEKAILAASQHERNPLDREELLTNPIQFLKSRGWIGLLNIDSREKLDISPILNTDAPPLEDQSISVGPSGSLIAHEWNRTSPTPSGRKNAIANIDLISRERANKSHYLLEEALTKIARRLGHAPKYNQNIDLFFETLNGTILAEIKSCTDKNFHGQLRKGISQLFEYRFLYADLFESEVTMLLLMETSPPKEKRWLVDFAQSLGIIVAWGDRTSNQLLTTCKSPNSLSGIIQVLR